MSEQLMMDGLLGCTATDNAAAERLQPQPAKTQRWTIREVIAASKLGNPAGFEFYRWEVVGPDAVMLTGCVCSGAIYTNGKRKGRKKYDGTPMTAVVTDAEEAAAKTRYQAQSGNCPECMGDGKEFAAWHFERGTTWRDCRACKGTGKS